MAEKVQDRGASEQYALVHCCSGTSAEHLQSVIGILAG